MGRVKVAAGVLVVVVAGAWSSHAYPELTPP